MNLNVYKPFTFVLRFTMPASTDRLTFLDVFAGDTPQALLAYESSDQPQYIVWALYGEVWSPLVYEYSFEASCVGAFVDTLGAILGYF